MLKAIICSFSALLFVAPGMASASYAPPGTVSYPWAANSGVFMFDVSSNKNSLPPCSGIEAVPHRWAINSSTAAGQAMVALVMSAYMNGKQVQVNGYNNCNLWSDTETVWFINIVN